VADEQTSPAGVQSDTPATAGTPQTPRLAPEAFVQAPPQQSASVAQASPSCVQKDGLPSQTPFVQSFEQQSALPAQGLPLVLQLGLRGAHVFVPAAQLPPQHWESELQAWLSAVHWVAPQVPLPHTNVQHSGPAAQVAPAALHRPFPGPPPSVQPASSQLVALPSVLSTAAALLPQPVKAKALGNATSTRGTHSLKMVRVMPALRAIDAPGRSVRKCEKSAT
jgi:hypothetical protein